MIVYTHNLAKQFESAANWVMHAWVLGRLTIVWDANRPGPQSVSADEIFGERRG